jgi:hypothetical protein
MFARVLDFVLVLPVWVSVGKSIVDVKDQPDQVLQPLPLTTDDFYSNSAFESFFECILSL